MDRNLKIGIIAGKKSTDSFLCEKILNNFPNSKVIIYQIPLNMWFRWVIRRIRKMGIIIFIGHILLSIYLRFQRKIESLFKESIWLTYLKEIPSWKKVKNKKFCLSEENLTNELNNVDMIILTDQFRLTYKFFRNVKVPCIELVWGMVPNYLGNSGGFWAFAIKDNRQVGISIVERFSQFNKLKVLYKEALDLNIKEDLRTIKVKQVYKMSKNIHSTIINYSRDKQDYVESNKNCRLFQAPTLFTYLKFLIFGKLNRLPKYAYNRSKLKLIHKHE